MRFDNSLLMPKIRSHLLTYAALACLAMVSGCTTPNLFSGGLLGMGRSSSEDADGLDTDRQELPPKEAARACFVAAEELQKGGHIEQAIALYEKGRRNDPEMKSIAHRLAVLYDIQGDSVRSLAEYNKALQSDPKNPGLLSDLGYYYYERGDLAEAEQSLRKALAIEPNHQKALTNLGLVLAGEVRFNESFAAFAKVVGPAAVHSNVGVLMAKQGRNDQAREEFRQALAMDATLPQPKAFLAYLDKHP